MVMKKFLKKNIISKAFACFNNPIEGKSFESFRNFFLNLTMCTKRCKPSREQYFSQTFTKGEKYTLMPSTDNIIKKDKLHLFGFQYSLKPHQNYKERESSYFASLEQDFSWNEHLLLIQSEVKKNKSWSSSSLLALTQELMKN
ncbi:hypothetical protein HMI54_015816 [Coelomomyces lativittatus]|nr:hypothetical protein HMI54_015816 [Coelomomyces lativittatus]